MEIGICSYSFHRLLAAGKQDIFQYITDCKILGCTQLDPWNAHLSQCKKGDEILHAGNNPGQSHHLSAADEHYIAVDADFTNVEDAVRRFRDPVQRQAIVDRAYDHVVSGHTYAHRTRTVLDELRRL